MHEYRCRCGCTFEEALGKYGCPSCGGDSGPARLALARTLAPAYTILTTQGQPHTGHRPGPTMTQPALNAERLADALQARAEVVSTTAAVTLCVNATGQWRLQWRDAELRPIAKERDAALAKVEQRIDLLVNQGDARAELLRDATEALTALARRESK